VQTSVFGLILAMAIESCCIPLPSEVVIPIAGLLFAQGKLLPGLSTPVGIIILGLAGALGNLLGSIAAYWIGYKGGRPLMLKYGRYVLISQHDADIADSFFQKYGSATAFFGRLLPVIRTFISLPAGITKMPFGKFCIYTFIGAFPWCVMLAYAGVVLKGQMTAIEPYYKSAQYVVVAAVVVLIVLYVWRHIRNDNKARAAHAADEAAKAQQPQVQQPWQQSQPPQQGNWQQPQMNNWQQPQPPQQGNWQQPQNPSQFQPPRR
jgi:membrane protein DedA with SNARE-associated domain